MLYILCHIISDSSVSSGECPEKLAIAVGKANGCAVELELAAVCECVSDPLCSSFCESFNLGDVVSVSKRKHRIFMRMLFKLLFLCFSFAQVASDFLGRGVRHNEFRICGLDRFQFL